MDFRHPIYDLRMHGAGDVAAGWKPALRGGGMFRGSGSGAMALAVKAAWQGGGILFNWPRLMTKLPAILSLVLAASLLSLSASAQEKPPVDVRVESLTPDGFLDVDPATGTYTGTNGVVVTYSNMVLMADSMVVNTKTHDVKADGHVHITSGEEI